MDKKILTVGCAYKPVKGGIGQVLEIYEQYIFEEFEIVVNSGKKGLRNWLVLLSAIFDFVHRLLSNKEIEIVHIHTASYNSFYRSAIFLLLGRMSGKKVILHIHGGGFKEFYHSNPSLICRILRRAHCIVVLSRSWQDFFSGVVKRKLIEVVPNPVVLPSEEELQRREQSPLLRLLFLGLLDSQKGIYDLLDVLEREKSCFRGRVVLNVGGNGDTSVFERRVLEKGLSDLVTFHGWVSGEKKKQLLLDSDVFVLPSYVEGLPMAILEAMAHGLAILSTPVGGIPEVVDESSGFLIRPGDKDALAERLKTLCDNPDILNALKKGSRRAGVAYSTDAVREVLNGVYQKVLMED